MNTTYQYDHYYNYEELTACLSELAKQYPDIMKLESICTSLEGKEVWAVTLSEESHQAASKKPAYYIDANHHAGEVTGSMAAMYTIDTLCTLSKSSYAKLLSDYTVYVIPRISPDGADAFLNKGEHLRSVNRPYPYSKMDAGVHEADMDQDGIIRQMRIPSVLGEWKKDPTDERIMIKRLPDDTEGDFYHVVPEGSVVDYDGYNLYQGTDKWGLDFNRNYPFGWCTEVRQPGAGKYPLSNPENKAVADFVLDHPNIGFVSTLHTTGGVLVYPPGTYPSKQASGKDMAMYQAFGKIAKETMGYPTVNIFDAFLTDTVNYSSGAFDDWCYETQGIPAYTIELWNLAQRAGCDTSWPKKEQSDEEKAEEYKKMIAWVDKHVDGGFQPWTKVQHPVLGEVEIGGIDFRFTVQNPPCNYLEAEAAKTAQFMLKSVMGLPKLAFLKAEATKQAEGVYQIEAVIANTGFLPTDLTEAAQKQQVIQPLEVSLQCEGVILSQPAKETITQLEGFGGVNTYYGYDGINTEKSTPTCMKLQWIVKAEASQEITISVHSMKAGNIQKSIRI